MAKQIVTKAEGEVYRLEADGSKIKLQTGDLVETGTRIITETGASVRFEDENGIPMELGENSGAILFSDVEIEPGNMLFAEESEEAAGEAIEAEQPDTETENPLPSDSRGDTTSEMHSFVEMTRTEYGGDINLSYARDVNVTREIEGRASLNPRIEYDYNVSIIQEVKSYEDPRFPFDGGGRGGEESRFEPVRPAADTIPMPETTGTAAVTDEDVPVVIDPLENFVIPSGLQLAVTGASAQYGTVQIIDGKIAYQPNADYHGGDKITVTVTDQAGRTYESEVDVTVSPVVDTVDDSDSVAEHASVDTDVLANDKFADLPGAKVTEVTQGQYGEVTINEDGTVKYTPKTDWLADGETLTDTYQYTVTTAAGNTETATVTITITGTNDTPVLKANATDSVIEDTTDSETASGSLTRDIHFTDADTNDSSFTTTGIKFGDVDGTVGQEIKGEYGKFVIDENGNYSYSIDKGSDNAKVDSLKAGETVTDTFTATVSDDHGGTVDIPIVITVTGTNDAPIATDNSSQENDVKVVIEDDGTANATTGNVITSGTPDSDVDHNAVITVKDVKLSTATSATSVNADGETVISGKYGTLTIKADGSYTYTLDNSKPDTQALAQDQETTEVFDVTIKDELGATASSTLTIDIEGTNDQPQITGDDTKASIDENGEGLKGTIGTLSLKDIDTNDTVTLEVTDVEFSGDGSYTNGLLSTKEQLLNMLSLAQEGLSSTTTDGKIIWTFNSHGEEFNYLPADKELILKYTIKATDSSGADNNNDTETITIAIKGKDDTITGASADTNSGKEDSGEVTGNVFYNDTYDVFENAAPAKITEFKVNGDSNTYTAGNTINIANVGDITIMEDGSYVFRPATNYSGNIPQITYTATVPTDNLGNTTNISSTLDIKIAPVAETVKGNGSGDPNGGPNTSLTINPDHKYDDSSNVAENNGKTENWYNLNPEGENSFNLKDGWNNPDGKDNLGMTSSEDTYALLTPVLDGPAGDSAVGCKFSYSDGTQTYEHTYDGKTPIKIPAQYLNTVKFLPSPYSSGKYEITVQAMTVDSDGSTTVTAVSGNAVLSNIIVTPVPDGVDTIAVKQAVGDEDTYIDLDIKPSSQDLSENFNVRISDIPKGATIKYGGAEYKCGDDGKLVHVNSTPTSTDIELDGGKIIIKNFDTSKLSILPPKDSNVDFVLKVEAQSVESDGNNVLTSAWTDTINLDVTVHSVADEVTMETREEKLTYTEVQAEHQEIKLSSLIIKAADADDGSEQVTLTVTGLAPEFTLVGTAVEFKGGAGTERTWLVTMDKNNISNTKAYIKTPNNFSGEIKFSAQATNTDTCTNGISDSNSCTSEVTDVTITVTPTPEATVKMSAAAAEDELTQLSFAIKHKNGDNDETLSTIYIKASDANGGDGKNFTIVYSEDGKTYMSLEEALTNGKIEKEEIDGVKYYKITADGEDVHNIYVKGDGNYSGKGEDNSFSFKYEITDEEYTGEETHTTSDPVTKITDATYNVTFTPVTDATTMEAVVHKDFGGITDGGLTLEGTTVTVNSTQAGTDNDFSVKVTVNAPADTDGSEHLVSLIVDGVPDGVKVENAIYLGDSEAEPGAGRWLITISDNKVFDNPDSSIEQTINFTVDRGNPNIWALNGQGAQKITITAVSQDRIDGMSGKETESSTKADFDIKINFTGEGPGLTDIPAPGMNITPGGGTVEDAESCALADFFTAKYNYTDDTDYQGQTEFRFSITIKGFPDDATITGDAVVGKGVTISAENGSVTISGFGDDAAIESILKNVKVELPKDYNNNTDGNPNGMKLDVTWKTEGWDLNKNDGSTPTLSGGSDDPIYANVTPVTDPMEITITSENAVIDENQSKETAAGINFTIKVGDGGDGTYGQILYDKLYVKLADGSGEAHGTVKYGEVEYKLTEVKDVEGIADGKYYVIKNVNVGDRIELTYTPDTFYSGNVTVTAQLASQETGAGNIATSEGSLGLTVTPVNTEYNFEVNGAETDENGKAYLTFTPDGAFDKDGSEVVHCAYISGFDAAHGDDFIVKYMLDGVEMTASKVAAGDDGKGNTLYQWVISVGQDGHLPTDVRIVGLNHYSGTQHLTATVVTGETALGTGLTNTFDFDVTFEPTADGFTSFTPTLTFGNSGEYIDLNLNAMVTDTTANNTVETATVTLTGLGDGASFFIEDGGEYKAVTTAYDAGTDTYIISGIALDKINDVKILTPNTGSYSVTVDAWTVVGEKASDPISADPKFGSSFDIKVGEASPTDEGDTLIYNGGGSYDGKGGEDILFMANFREAASAEKNDIDFSKAVDIKNIEIIDMSNGDHTLANLTAKAVKDMTDGMNTLLIKGDDGDKIALSKGWTGGNIVDGYRVYTNDGATIKVAGDVNVTISNGIDTTSLMMAMAFAPISSEAAVMPDSITDYGDGSIYDGIHGSAPLSIGTEGTLDFSAVSGSMLDSIDMTNDTAQSLFNVDPFGVYNVTGGSHELTITGPHIDDVSVVDASDVPWGAPELSADGSHYTYTATGDFDHNAATPDETVTLNVAREIYDDTLAYDAHALNDGGLGDDTLTFGHEDSVIDFSDGAASQIANIERFDLGDGDHSLANITAKDVFDMTDGRNTLTINGDNADHVSLSDVLNDSSDGMWEASPFHSVENGVSYNVYTGSFEGHTVILKVEEDIIQQLTGISKA